MDENKNWVNWRKYNAYQTFACVDSTITGGMNYICEFDGTYVMIGATCGAPTITFTNSGNLLSFDGATYQNNKKAGYRVFTAHVGDVVKCSLDVSNNSNAAIYFITSLFATSATESSKTYTADTSISMTLENNSSNQILVGACTGQNSYVTVANGSVNDVTTAVTNRSACISTVNEVGTGTIGLLGSGYGSLLLCKFQLYFD